MAPPRHQYHSLRYARGHRQSDRIPGVAARAMAPRRHHRHGWRRSSDAMSEINVLLTPGRIGSVEIKNRIVMPPMTTRLADEDGSVTEHTINYYMARVRGGVGLITVEMASPTRAGRHRRRELGIYDNRFLPGL